MTEATNTTSATPSLVSDFNIRKILDLLPRRYPMLLVDHVTSLEPRRLIAAIKNVTSSEPFSNGHFPGHPVMPDILMLEALAQTTALLTFSKADHGRKENQLYLFVSIDGARFKRQVTSGGQLVTTVELLRSKGDTWKFKVCDKVDGEVAVGAEIICAMRKNRSKDEA